MFEEIDKRQKEQYHKAKIYHDEKKKAKESDIMVGDYVIMKEAEKTSKMSSAYSKTVYVVIERNQSLIRVKDELVIL